jgi:hypothetical protein
MIKILENKNPFVSMVSKTAYQIIQSNNDIIIEKIIDEICTDCSYDISNIDKKKIIFIRKTAINSAI